MAIREKRWDIGGRSGLNDRNTSPCRTVISDKLSLPSFSLQLTLLVREHYAGDIVYNTLYINIFNTANSLQR